MVGIFQTNLKALPKRLDLIDIKSYIFTGMDEL